MAQVRGRGRGRGERILDTLYLAYFGVHLVASALIDAQLALPASLFPGAVQRVLADYLRDSGDPFLGGLARKDASVTWFRVLLLSETFVQIPCFVVGIYGLAAGE